MYMHVQLDKHSAFFSDVIIKNINVQPALRMLMYNSKQVGNITAETELQHTVGINARLSYLVMIKE